MGLNDSVWKEKRVKGSEIFDLIFINPFNLKRYAVASAIAASAVPSLVMARGHRIEEVPEIPLVVGDSAEGIEKTQTAIKALKQVGAYADAEKAKDSQAIRPGKGKIGNNMI